MDNKSCNRETLIKKDFYCIFQKGGGMGGGGYRKTVFETLTKILDNVFLRYAAAALSQRVQELAGIDKAYRNQHCSPRASVNIDTCPGVAVLVVLLTYTLMYLLSLSHMFSSSLRAGSSSCRTLALCSRASK